MKNLKILFYLKNRKNSIGEQQIYLRLTVDGKRKECSLNRSISAGRWNKHKQCGKGNTEEMKILEKYLNSVKESFYRYQQEMIYNNQDITSEVIMNKYLGIGEKVKNLIEVIKEDNKRTKNLVKDGTYRKYLALLNHVEEYLIYQYKVSDLNIKKVNYQFVEDFDYYLRTEKSVGNNTSISYVKRLRKTLKSALNNGWIKTDPFVSYKAKQDKPDIEYLTEVELNSIHNKDFSITRLNQIRDVFVFACYTGLSYSDLAKLSNKHIVIGIDGNRWIKINRTKNGNLCSIPLLPQAIKILEKYKDNPLCINKGILLPVISNERYNAYLKEIGNICVITKNLTTHVARHTCGTMFADKQISIETIAKILGHSDIKTTQIYAKITDYRIIQEITKLMEVEDISTDNSKEAV